MNIEEATAMIGTEFIYVCVDGDEVQAYVKKFNPNIALTCLSLVTKTQNGFCPKDAGQIVEKDGTWCLISLSFLKLANRKRKLDEALAVLQEIKDTGRCVTTNMTTSKILELGHPQCRF